MYRMRHIQGILAFCTIVATRAALADGMVVPEVFFPKVEIPNQQALIHCADGIERLVIETSFLGEGTNFAWVVPLPAAPEVKPVSEGFFINLRQTFQPRLIHQVHPYYAGILFFCGLVLLGWRGLRNETSWLADLPLCLLLAVGAGFMAKSMVAGIVGGGLALCTRLFGRTPAILALFLLVGTTFDAALTFVPSPKHWGLINTLGESDAGVTEVVFPGVTVLSEQHAGVFDITTIRGTNPNAVRQWLDHNGYQLPASAEPAVRYYVEHGWVFVASKVRCATAGSKQAALHPLLFTFAARLPIYPTRLTAVANGICAMDLYVFGKRRATARHFDTVRCDRLASNLPSDLRRRRPGLGISDPEILALIGGSTVGTKLSARLSPKQMASDVDIHTGVFWRTGATVFSYTGALTIALNVALPLAVLGWLLAGTSQGGWKVTEKGISRCRGWLLAAAVGIGITVYLLLPKVEMVSRPASSLEDGRGDGLSRMAVHHSNLICGLQTR
ncbi:MAG: DUF2330 domain-containing protein [Verrucomicrobiota bacterium]